MAAGSVGWLATTPWAPLRPSVTAAAVAGSAAVPLVAVVVADRRRWSRIESGFSWTSDIAELYRAARALRDRGIAVTVDPDRPCLRFHAKDRRRVAACLTELGYPAPPT